MSAVQLRNILREALQAEIISDGSRQEAAAFLAILTQIKDEVRLYFLSKEVVENKIWTPFRSNDEALEYLMRFSMNFHFRLQEAALEPLFEKCIQGMFEGCLASGNYADKDFADKTTTGAEVALFPSWLKFVLLCLLEMRVTIAAIQG